MKALPFAEPMIEPKRFSVRRAEPSDAEALMLLLAEHADYERAERPTMSAVALSKLLGSDYSRLIVWIARVEGVVAGYASGSAEVATWKPDEYFHLDCLFVRDGFRGKRGGREIFDTVAAFAIARGFSRIEWQTPAWNDGAIRFYESLGANASAKQRFTFTLRRSEGRCA